MPKPERAGKGSLGSVRVEDIESEVPCDGAVCRVEPRNARMARVRVRCLKPDSGPSAGVAHAVEPMALRARIREYIVSDSGKGMQGDSHALPIRGPSHVPVPAE